MKSQLNLWIFFPAVSFFLRPATETGQQQPPEGSVYPRLNLNFSLKTQYIYRWESETWIGLLKEPHSISQPTSYSSVIESHAFGMDSVQTMPFPPTCPFGNRARPRRFSSLGRSQDLSLTLDNAHLAREIVVIHVNPDLWVARKELNVSLWEIWVGGCFSVWLRG